jgi:hypothetical protein
LLDADALNVANVPVKHVDDADVKQGQQHMPNNEEQTEAEEEEKDNFYATKHHQQEHSVHKQLHRQRLMTSEIPEHLHVLHHPFPPKEPKKMPSPQKDSVIPALEPLRAMSSEQKLISTTCIQPTFGEFHLNSAIMCKWAYCV